MQGLMMDGPIPIPSMIDYAAECHGECDVVSCELDGEIHRHTCGQARVHCKIPALSRKRHVGQDGARVGALASDTHVGFEPAHNGES